MFWRWWIQVSLCLFLVAGQATLADHTPKPDSSRKPSTKPSKQSIRTQLGQSVLRNADALRRCRFSDTKGINLSAALLDGMKSLSGPIENRFLPLQKRRGHLVYSKLQQWVDSLESLYQQAEGIRKRHIPEKQFLAALEKKRDQGRGGEFPRISELKQVLFHQALGWDSQFKRKYQVQHENFLAENKQAETELLKVFARINSLEPKLEAQLKTSDPRINRDEVQAKLKDLRQLRYIGTKLLLGLAHHSKRSFPRLFNASHDELLIYLQSFPSQNFHQTPMAEIARLAGQRTRAYAKLLVEFRKANPKLESLIRDQRLISSLDRSLYELAYSDINQFVANAIRQELAVRQALQQIQNDSRLKLVLIREEGDVKGIVPIRITGQVPSSKEITDSNLVEVQFDSQSSLKKMIRTKLKTRFEIVPYLRCDESPIESSLDVRALVNQEMQNRGFPRLPLSTKLSHTQSATALTNIQTLSITRASSIHAHTIRSNCRLLAHESTPPD